MAYFCAIMGWVRVGFRVFNKAVSYYLLGQYFYTPAVTDLNIDNFWGWFIII